MMDIVKIIRKLFYSEKPNFRHVTALLKMNDLINRQSGHRKRNKLFRYSSFRMFFRQAYACLK
mgnify:CR=1